MPTDVEASEGLVRIRVSLDRAEDEQGPAEDWLWAESLGSGRYRVESCPFLAYGISRDDVVHAAEPPERAPELEDIVEKGGHRTLRVALDEVLDLRAAQVQRLLARILELGCTHEVLRSNILAIDLPPEVDVARVAELLQGAVRQGSLVWEWADPRPC
jgi:hypothetical protein